MVAKGVRMAKVLLWTVVALALAGPVVAQLDGSFWWMNANLVKKAEALREAKNANAIVITEDSEVDEVRIQTNTYVDASDDEPDCVCVTIDRCQRQQPSGEYPRDGLCGTGKICCRKSKIVALPTTTDSTTPASTTSTTRATKLEPVAELDFTLPTNLDPLPAKLTVVANPAGSSVHDPELLQELSNLLLSHAEVDTFEPIHFVDRPLPAVTTTAAPATSSLPPTWPTYVVATSTSTVRPTAAPIPVYETTESCGIRQRSVSSRVWFQDEENQSIEEHLSGMVSFGEFPWTVAIYQLVRNGSFLYHCGGAMVNTSVVITSAHCVADNRNNPNRYVVRAGDWDRRHNQEKLPHQERTVSRIVLHPDYYSGALFNDIAVLRFDQPFDDAPSNIGSVCLPSDNADVAQSGTGCLVTGWGGTPRSNQEQSIQQFIRMEPVDRLQCEAKLQAQPTLGNRFKLHDSFLCAGGTPGMDTCRGAGGSPMVCERNGRYTVVGLVSWGIGCGTDVPAVLTNVASLGRWLHTVLQ